MSAPRFLIVNFGAIGDCVMVVPTITAIRRTYPDADITWAVEDRCADVVDTSRLVNHRHEVQWSLLKQRGSLSRTKAYLSYCLALRKHRFDFGLDLQGHSKTAMCLRLSRTKTRVSRRATDLLSRMLNPVVPETNPMMHVVERYFEVLKAVGEFGELPSPIMPELTSEQEKLRTQVDPVKKLATITVGAGTALKTVPLDHWHQVSDDLVHRGYQVAFIGGPQDPSPERSDVFDWVGKLRLSESMAAVSLSALHLCGDTGTGHIAAAYGTPVISVFGDQPPEKFRPYTDRGLILREGTEARNVSPAQIIDSIREMENRYGI